MTSDLKWLLEKAKQVKMSDSDKEAQRRSFAYGSAKIENNDITRQLIDDAADRLSRPPVNG